MCIPTIIKSESKHKHACKGNESIENQSCICVPYSPGQHQGTTYYTQWDKFQWLYRAIHVVNTEKQQRRVV